MLKITDKNLFLETVADAVAEAHLKCRNEDTRNRWINAIAKAAAVITEDDSTFLHWDHEKEILYFWSPDSNEIYETGEKCQCPAFLQLAPQPCYHRAMRRLVKNYFEFLQKPGEIYQIDFATAVFFDPELSVREKVNLLNLSILEGRVELKPRVAALEPFISS
jgi:hypothetical protein